MRGMRNRHTIYTIKIRAQKTNLDSPCREKNTPLLPLDNPKYKFQIMCVLKPTVFHSLVPPVTNLRSQNVYYYFLEGYNRLYQFLKSERLKVAITYACN